MRWNSRRGTTVIEMSIGAVLLLLILGVLSSIYVQGSAVWRKVDKETSLLRELQVAVRNLERELELGHPHGLTIGTQALAYLSCQDANNDITLNDRGEPVWQKFTLVYVDPEGLLRRREVARSAPDTNPLSFEEEFGTDLDTYLSNNPDPDDRRLTHLGDITRFELESSGRFGSLYELRLEAEQLKNSTETETLQLTTQVSVRNR